MKTTKELITDLFCNPDGSGSTKRTAGWILILSSLIFGIICTFIKGVDVSIFSMVFITAMSAGLSCFGLSSVDNKINVSALKNTVLENQPNTIPNQNTPDLNGIPQNI